MTKKSWNKPVIFTMKAVEVNEFVKVAARSGWCLGGDYR